MVSSCSRQARPELPYLQQDAVILAFGDSLTHGTGALPEDSYPAVLESLIDRRVVTVATPGDQSEAGLRKLPDALTAHQPALVILCLGGNDFLRRRDEAETVANLDAMIEMIRARDAEVLLLGVPKPGLFGLDGHPLYRELAQRHRVVLDNDSIAAILSERALKADQIHPNAAGYRQLAQSVADLLRRAGAV